MICEECQKEGLKSTIRIGVSSSTLAYCPPFYDEEGRLHHHDPNINTINYSCSNGHNFSKSSKSRCWCEEGK